MKKITVITGGTGGMGFAIANSLGRQGAVLLLDLNEEVLKSSVESLERQNMEAHSMVVDISDEAQVRSALERAKEIGRVTNVIHTAGVSPVQVSGLDDKAAAEKIITVNACGTVNMVDTFFPALDAGGAMICFSSVAAYMIDPCPEDAEEIFDSAADDKAGLLQKMLSLTDGSPGIAYMFSKMFVRRYIKMNAMRFGDKGCRIISIAPGRIYTPQHRALIEDEPERIEEELASTPLHRYGAAYEIASLVEFLCSSGASFINGFDILMDGGFQAATTAPQVE